MTNLEIFRGDTKSYNLTFVDDDGAAIDLTNATIYFTVKTSPTVVDASASIQKIVTSHTDAVNGLSQVSLTATDTNLTIGTYYYDIQLSLAAGDVITVVSGLFIVKQDVTLT